MPADIRPVRPALLSSGCQLKKCTWWWWLLFFVIVSIITIMRMVLIMNTNTVMLTVLLCPSSGLSVQSRTPWQPREPSVLTSHQGRNLEPWSVYCSQLLMLLIAILTTLYLLFRLSFCYYPFYFHYDYDYDHYCRVEDHDTCYNYIRLTNPMPRTTAYYWILRTMREINQVFAYRLPQTAPRAALRFV